MFHLCAILGSGGVLGGAGARALTYLWSRSSFKGYDDGIAGRCRNGCDAATVRSFADLTAKLEAARTNQVVAFSLLDTGGAAVLTPRDLFAKAPWWIWAPRYASSLG